MRIMIRTRWIKVLQDLWGNRNRTITVALALAVGVYAIGVILDARELLAREYARDRAGTLMSSAIIRTSPFDDNFAERISEMPDVAAAEGRTTISTQITLKNGERKELKLSAVSDLTDMQVDKITMLAYQGSFPDDEVILERLALDYLGVEIGDEIQLELDDGTKKSVSVGGIAHDPQQLTPSVNHKTTGFITKDGMRKLGYDGLYNELHIRMDDEIKEEAAIRNIVDQIEKQVENSGRLIYSTTIITDNPVDSIIDTVILMLSAMGWVILLLSGFLVINAISALVTQQVQQIGIMKLIGASRIQIVNMYLATLFFYGSISALVSIPLAMVTAQLLITELVQDLVNIIPDSLLIPIHVVLIQVLVAFLLPLLAGLLPVLRGTQVTTQEALNDNGMKDDSRGGGVVERLIGWFQKLRPLQRTYLLAARNALRHKGRLVQTLFVLIFGTALFISVLTVNNSVETTLDNFLNYHQYDVSVGMKRPYRVEELESTAQQIQDVEYVESWTIDSAKILRLDDTESNHYRLYAVPVSSELIDPQLINGRWLVDEDINAFVINSDVYDKESEIKLGDTISLEIGGYETSGRLVGIVRTDSQGPSIYMDLDDYANVTNTRGRATNVQIVANLEDQNILEQRIYQVFESSGLEISETRTSSQINQRNQLMFTLVIAVLILMALLLAGVGGLGLSTTMSINLLERIREIGVLRAIGASNLSVRWVILLEGLFIGALSWIIGTLLSIPISIIFSEQVGIALLKIPLVYHYSFWGMAIWLIAIMFISVAASLGPARNAERLTVREVLSYE